MGLYVWVYSSETGLAITNATFYWYNFSNLGNGEYFYWAPYDVTGAVGAPGKNTLWFNTDTLYVGYAYLVNTPPPHSDSHSSGGGYT